MSHFGKKMQHHAHLAGANPIFIKFIIISYLQLNYKDKQAEIGPLSER
jgi:hypothetical protein